MLDRITEHVDNMQYGEAASCHVTAIFAMTIWGGPNQSFAVIILRGISTSDLALMMPGSGSNREGQRIAAYDRVFGKDCI